MKEDDASDAALPFPLLDSLSPAEAGALPAMIGFTSGTTGKPKGALSRHAALLSGAEMVIKAWEWVRQTIEKKQLRKKNN